MCSSLTFAFPNILISIFSATGMLWLHVQKVFRNCIVPLMAKDPVCKISKKIHEIWNAELPWRGLIVLGSGRFGRGNLTHKSAVNIKTNYHFVLLLVLKIFFFISSWDAFFKVDNRCIVINDTILHAFLLPRLLYYHHLQISFVFAAKEVIKN